MIRGKKILRFAMTALTLALALGLCWGVIDVYVRGAAARRDTGDFTRAIFTRESVGARLRALRPLGALWLAALVAAIFTNALTPVRSRPVADAESDALFLRALAADRGGEDRLERDYRRLVRLIGGLCAAALLLPVFACLLDGARFSSWDLETVMGDLLRWALPPLAAAFALGMICARLEGRSFIREREALRERLRRDGKGELSPDRVRPRTVQASAWLRWALFVLAAAMIGLGIFNGGLNDVLVKAINICTECIGLG